MIKANPFARKVRILLVNPWIYDFSAYNLWAKPLGLLKVVEFLSAYNVDFSFIDCLDKYKVKNFGAGKYNYEIVDKPTILKDLPLFYKRYGIPLKEFIYRLKASMPFDIVLITSIMSYWYLGVQKTVEIIRDIAGNVPIVLGGIYATIYPDHALKISNADHIYKGRIGEKFIEVLENFGIRLIREKNPLNYYNLNLYDHYPFAPLLTTEGCPFRCTYCASTILSNSHYKIPIKDILREIIEFYKRGVRDFAFYDDALLIDSSEHIKPILKKIIDLELDIRLHTPNGLHARFIDDELAFLMKRAGFKTIRLSLETVNSDRQIKTGAKVNNEDLINAVNCLKKEGYTKKEIGVYLMYGIPDQNLEEIKEGVEFLKTLGVRINLTEFSPIKGTLEWFNLINKKIIDNDLDPLLTNNSVFYYLYSTFDLKELEALKQDVKNYNNKQ